MRKPFIRVPNSVISGDSAAQPTRSTSSSFRVADLNPSLEHPTVDPPLEPLTQSALIYGGTTGSVAVPPEAPSNFNDNSTSTEVAADETAPTATWSTSVQNVLDQPPTALPRRLLIGAMGFCLGFGTWAWFGQIEEVARAQGQLVPKGSVYKIHPIDLGKVAVVGVKEGQEVKAGQAIVELDTKIAENEVKRLQQTLEADRSQLEEMQTLIERKRLEAHVQAQIANANLQAQKTAIAQVQANTVVTQTLMAQGQANREAQEMRLNRLKPLVKEGAISKEQLFEAEQSLRDRQSELIRSQGELQKASTEPARLQAELTQKQAEGQSIQLETQQQIQQLEVEMNQLKAKIADNQNLLDDAKTRLNQRFLRAPVSGTVLSLKIPKAGEVVQPGQMVAEIAPDNTPLTLSAALPNQEAGLVKTGMPVHVKFDAYPYQDYGIVPGKVTFISPNAQTEEGIGSAYQPNAQPNAGLGSVYRIEVVLDRNSVTANKQTIKFKPGQTASAEIIVRRRRIADVLFDPIRKLQTGGVNL